MAKATPVVHAISVAIALARPGAIAQVPAPAPSPSASPSAPADPCGSILSIVNRPTFGTGVCTVQTGHFDVEAGYQSTVTTGPGGGANPNYPQLLVRVGTFDPHLDFEVGVPSYNRSSAGNAITSGWNDLSLGAKYELGYGPRWVYGANAVVTIPTGIHGFTAGNAQFSGNFNWGYTVNSEFGIAGTLGFNALSGINAAGAPQSYFAFEPTILATAALPGGPSQLFGEYAYFTQGGPNLGGRSWADFGYQRDVGPHLQFDVEYGFSPTLLNGQTQHYIGAGLSFMN